MCVKPVLICEHSQQVRCIPTGLTLSCILSIHNTENTLHSESARYPDPYCALNKLFGGTPLLIASVLRPFAPGRVHRVMRAHARMGTNTGHARSRSAGLWRIISHSPCVLCQDIATYSPHTYPRVCVSTPNIVLGEGCSL